MAVHLRGMEKNRAPAGGLEPLLSIEELAEYLNVPVRTLYDWRVAGKGPCAVRIGRQIKFVSDVHEWIASQREARRGGSPSGADRPW